MKRVVLMTKAQVKKAADASERRSRKSHLAKPIHGQQYSEDGKPINGTSKARKDGKGGRRTTRLIKEAILRAADLVGEDGRGRHGLVGYMKRLAKNEPVAFAGLLGKVLPLQIVGDASQPLRMRVEGTTAAEAAQLYAETLTALRANPVLQITDTRKRDDNVIDAEYEEVEEAAE